MLLTAAQTRSLLGHALQNHYAVLAINADSPACLTDALEAARQLDAPLIIEASLWQLTGHSFGAGDAALGMARYLAQLEVLAASARFAAVPVAFHTDHIKGVGALELLQTAIRGFPLHNLRLRPSSLSLDASELTHQQNIAAICALCETALEVNTEIVLEMEAGVDDGVTSLEEAQALLGGVEARYPGRVALWAPGVGTRHGLGNQDAFNAEAVRQHQRLASKLTGHEIGIALHGSSGLSADALRAAVAAGVCKVNWSSESLLTRNRATLEFYRTHQAELEATHKDWKTTAMDNGVQSFIAQRYLPVVTERMRLLGGAGQASRFLREQARGVTPPPQKN